MSHMQFKLAFPPPKISMNDEELLQHANKSLQKFENYIKDHSITFTYEILKIAKEEVEASLPQFTELEVEIRALHMTEKRKSNAYQHLCRKWMDLSKIWNMFSGLSPPIPLLVLDHKAFERSLQSAHRCVPVTDVVFGILPSPSEFVSFISLKNLSHVSFDGKVDFCHDQSKVDIPVTCGVCNWVMTFSYRNIR